MKKINGVNIGQGQYSVADNSLKSIISKFYNSHIKTVVFKIFPELNMMNGAGKVSDKEILKLLGRLLRKSRTYRYDIWKYYDG